MLCWLAILGLGLTSVGLASTPEDTLSSAKKRFTFYGSTASKALQDSSSELPYLVKLSATLPSKDLESGSLDSSFVNSMLAEMYQGIAADLKKVGVKAEDIGGKVEAYLFDMEMKQGITVADLNSPDFQLPTEQPQDSSAKNDSVMAIVRQGRLVITYGKPAPELIDAILKQPQSPNLHAEIMNIKVDWQRFMAQKNLDFDKSLSLILNEVWGIKPEEAEFAAILRKYYSYARFATKFMVYLKTIELSIQIDKNNFSSLLKFEPLPASPMADFARQHERRDLSLLKFTPENSGIIVFASLEPDAALELNQEMFEANMAELPWTQSEAKYFRDTRQLIKEQIGDLSSFAIYQHPTKGFVGTMFVESAKSQEILHRWLGIFRLALAREQAVSVVKNRDAGRGSFDLPSSPYNLAGLLGLPKESLYEKKNKDGYYCAFQTEGEKYISVNARGIPEGVLAIASLEDSRPVLDQFLKKHRKHAYTSLLNDPFIVQQGPWFGLLINFKVMAEWDRQLKTDSSRQQPNAFDNALSSLDGSATMSLFFWSEGDNVLGSFQMPMKFLELANKTRKPIDKPNSTY